MQGGDLFSKGWNQETLTLMGVIIENAAELNTIVQQNMVIWRDVIGQSRNQLYRLNSEDSAILYQ